MIHIELLALWHPCCRPKAASLRAELAAAEKASTCLTQGSPEGRAGGRVNDSVAATVAPTTEGLPFLVEAGGQSGDHSASEIPDTVDRRLLQYTRTDSSLP